MKRLLLLTLTLAVTAAAQVSIPYRNITSKPAAIDAIDELTPAANKFTVYQSGTTAALADVTPFALTLLDDANAAAFKTTLTLQNVDNTSDATKWAATATLTNKTFSLASNTFAATSAQLASAVSDETGSGAAVFATSPALAGTPTAPTATAGTNTTQLATTAFVEVRARSITGGSGSLIQDGTTANRRVEWALSSLAGLPLVIPFELQVPQTIPASTLNIAFFSSSYLTPLGANSLAIYINSTGQLYVAQTEVTTPSIIRRYIVRDGFHAAYAGQWVRGAVVFNAPDTANAPTVYAQGEVLSMGGPYLDGAGTNWLNSATNTTRFHSATQSGASAAVRFTPHLPTVGYLSAAQIATWHRTGLFPVWHEAHTGSASSVVAGDDSTFSAGTGNWVTASGALVASDGKGVATLSSTTTFPYLPNIFTARTAGAAVVKVKLRLASGTLGAGGIQLSNSSGEILQQTWTNLATGVAGTRGVVVPTSTEQEYMFQVEYQGTGTFGLGIEAAAGATFPAVVEIDDLQVFPAGPLGRPVVQPLGPLGGVIGDAGGGRVSGVATAGILAATRGDRGAIRGRLSWSGTHEAKVFIADQALIPANSTIESIVVTASANTSGTGLSIGDGDTTSHWVASTTLTGGADKTYFLTLANRIPQSSVANDLKFYVDPDSANYTGTLNITVNYVLTY